MILSTPWEDPIANALIDFAQAMDNVAKALDKMGNAWLADVKLKREIAYGAEPQLRSTDHLTAADAATDGAAS